MPRIQHPAGTQMQGNPQHICQPMLLVVAWHSNACVSGRPGASSSYYSLCRSKLMLSMTSWRMLTAWAFSAHSPCCQIGLKPSDLAGTTAFILSFEKRHHPHKACATLRTGLCEGTAHLLTLQAYTQLLRSSAWAGRRCFPW